MKGTTFSFSSLGLVSPSPPDSTAGSDFVSMAGFKCYSTASLKNLTISILMEFWFNCLSIYLISSTDGPLSSTTSSAVTTYLGFSLAPLGGILLILI
jgi:hypothetical protein